MKLKLSTCGNPDHFQDPAQPLYGCEEDRVTTVNSLEEASAECKKFIDRNFLGAGNWSGGEVYEGEKRIAKIAYNGRILYEQ